MRIIRATETEKQEYRERRPTPLYPLYGFVAVDGHAVAVEDLRGSWKAPDPVFEAMAPDGYIFSGHGTHSLLGIHRRDLIERLTYAKLVRCECDECTHAKVAMP